MKEFKSNQTAAHLLDGVEEIYDYLEDNHKIYRESQELFLHSFHYGGAQMCKVYVPLFNTNDATKNI